MRALAKDLTIVALSHRAAWVDIADQVCELNPDEFDFEPEAEASSL